ncbi:PRC-barrel domain-containing protein [Vreelandella rituensis]|uniref:PRC-barrel domain containing protein n=1 Tax=Vreelandella rituensis TaxID=2282306 RepID=A0A368U2E0_9GAMM|nr:PRC-barrel domain-containing protein [Halomonas rituensis]RCV89283.1 PRC-barrel domain containing protein [Halomonas rituensis]
MKHHNTTVISTLFVSAFALSIATAHAQQQSEPTEGQAGSITGDTQMHGSPTDKEAMYVTRKEQNEFLADDLMDTEIHSTTEDDEGIGSIEDLIINEDGEITAVIVNVGGFLGMGEKQVAIEWDSLELTQEGDDYVIKTNASQDALENAEEFESE